MNTTATQVGTNGRGTARTVRTNTQPRPQSYYRIERNVPLPSPARKVGKYEDVPFGELSLGDSIFVPGADARGLGATAAAFCRAKAPTWRFLSRNVTDGARVWRMK